MEPEIVIVIVDFEEDLLARDLDETKIVLAKRVTVLIKIVVSRDRGSRQIACYRGSRTVQDGLSRRT